MKARALTPTLVAVTFLLLAVLAISGCGTDDGDSPFNDEIDAVIDRGVPGVAVQLDDGKTNVFYTRGAANLKSGEKIGEQSSFRAADISKAFNGALILALVEEDELELDDKAGEWIKDLLPRAKNVTIAEMLQHTSGIPDYTRVPEFGLQIAKDPERRYSPRELLGYVKNAPLIFDPGSDYAYSDTNTNALAIIAERAMKTPYEELMEEFVFGKALMNRTELANDPPLPQPFTSGYQLVPGVQPSGEPENVTEKFSPTFIWAAGAFTSTLEDISKFFHASAKATLFSRDLLRQQRETVLGQSSPPGPGDNHSGLGMYSYTTDCGVAWGYTGSFPGYRTFAATNPDGSKSVTIYVNATETTPAAADAITELQEAALCEIL